jgi:hypothetical protein
MRRELEQVLVEGVFSAERDVGRQVTTSAHARMIQ